MVNSNTNNIQCFVILLFLPSLTNIGSEFQSAMSVTDTGDFGLSSDIRR